MGQSDDPALVMRLSNGDEYQRTNHQIRALIRKNIVLQLRQKKTNCCQIGFPVFFMVLLGVLTLSYTSVLPEGQPEFFPPAVFSPINTTFPCAANNASVNAEPAGYGVDGALGGDVCGTFDHLYFVNPADHTAGELTNSTDPAASKSGLLGRIPQHYYVYGESYEGGGYINAPYFDEWASASDVDVEIFNLLNDQLENKTVMYSMPTGVVVFNEIESEATAQTLDYLLQLKKQPTGVNRHWDDDDITQQYPNATNWSSKDRVVQYLSYMHSSLLSNAMGIPEDGEQLSITVSTESMLQATWPYVYPMAAVGGCSVIPFALAFLLPVYVYLLVLEKSEKHLEMMRIMGMKKVTYWGVNFLFFLVLYAMVLTIVIILGLCFMMGIFYMMNPLVYLTHFLLWGVLQVAFAFFLSTLFQNPKSASIFSYLVVFLGVGFCYQISLWVVGPDSTGVFYFLLLCFPTFPFVRGVYLMEHPFFVPQFSSTYGWDVFINFTDPLMVCWYFMIGEILLCFLLTLYLDKVMPRAYGIQHHPLFPLFWVKRKIDEMRGAALTEKQKEAALYESMMQSGENSDLRSLTNEKGEVVREEDEDCFKERERANDPETDCLLRIVDMNKIYKAARRSQTDKWALRKLSFTVNNNECFGLLGPNGAGKTTLQSILCGLIYPSSGYAMLAGHHIPGETETVYNMIGYCPQHDVLWEDLTIKEHLLFYCRLKGIPTQYEKEEVERLVERVQLGEAADRKAGELSGGMKRRLSVAIALIGDPRFVLLDEPTTGVDPVNRRAIWDILSREKEGRCLILTTHNMEEADVLCNRIGIMARGQLICIGTQAHLKKKFGTGFTLQITSVDPHASHDFVMNLFPNAEQDMDSSMSGIFCYRIPQNSDVDLVGLFKAMKDRANYGIKEWSIQQTTLEEVFLKVFEFEEAATD